MIKFPINICSKPFFLADLYLMRKIISDCPAETRAGLSRLMCHKFAWFTHSGRLKDMACRVAMLKLHRNGLIKLPPPRCSKTNQNINIKITSISDQRKPIVKPVAQLGLLSIQKIQSSNQSQLWNQLIQRYHYLGYSRLPGAQIRYFIHCQEGLLAALGFSAAAWKIAPRDKWIGWNNIQRQQNLHLIVNNSRFLILPWVESLHLASKILARCAKQLPLDWLELYGYKPLLLETFVEKNKFKGTCYRAANWHQVGQTKGRGKKDFYHQHQLPVKDIWLYPLTSNFRKELSNDNKK